MQWCMLEEKGCSSFCCELRHIVASRLDLPLAVAKSGDVAQVAFIHRPSQSMVPRDALAHMAAKAGGTPETSLPPAGEPLAGLVQCFGAVLSFYSAYHSLWPPELVVSCSIRSKDQTACATVCSHQYVDAVLRRDEVPRRIVSVGGKPAA